MHFQDDKSELETPLDHQQLVRQPQLTSAKGTFTNWTRFLMFQMSVSFS